MKKEQQGIVIEVREKIAIVKMIRHGDCDNCGTCAGNNAPLIEMYNQINARKGEKVVFEPAQTGMFKAVLIVFWLPILSIFIGSQIGALISKHLSNAADIYQVVGAAIAFLLSLLFIIFYEKKVKTNLGRLPKVTKSFSLN